MIGLPTEFPVEVRFENARSIPTYPLRTVNQQVEKQIPRLQTWEFAKRQSLKKFVGVEGKAEICAHVFLLDQLRSVRIRNRERERHSGEHRQVEFELRKREVGLPA